MNQDDIKTMEQATEKFSDLSCEQFENLVRLDELVLVDFYIQDCIQCELQAPILNEIKEEMGDKIKIIRINYERIESLKELPIRKVPSQLLYHDGVLMWCNNGVINKKNSMIYHLICCSVSN